MNLQEAIARAIQEPTLIDALSWVCVWETDRAVHQYEHNKTSGLPPNTSHGGMWDTCFSVIIRDTMAAWDTAHPVPKPKKPRKKPAPYMLRHHLRRRYDTNGRSRWEPTAAGTNNRYEALTMANSHRHDEDCQVWDYKEKKALDPADYKERKPTSVPVPRETIYEVMP